MKAIHLSISNNFARPQILWVLFFCYSIIVALVFQKYIVPNMPSLHSAGSALTNDATYFHGIAASLADDIRNHGWSQWKLFPNNSSAGHVSILAALYVVFGTEPMVAIPPNAALHALGGVLMFLIASKVVENKVMAKYVGVIAASAFILFPSAVNWYGQIHKDAYLIVGVLLVLLVWLTALRIKPNAKVFLKLLCFNAFGVFLIAFTRPSTLKILMLISLVVFVAFVILLLAQRTCKSKSILIFFMLVMLTLGIAMKTVDTYGGKNLFGNGYIAEVEAQTNNWHWKNTEIAPDAVDKQFQALASIRLSHQRYGVGIKANSMIDVDVAPQNILEVIQYTPRALQIAMLAPFPNSWFEDVKLTKVLVSLEMVILYFSFVGLVFLVRYQFNASVLLISLFAITFLSIYGVTISNVGTLHRLRYPYEMLMLLLGVSGWMLLLTKQKILKL